VDFDSMSKRQKIQSFYKHIGITNLKNLDKMTQKPYSFKAFGVGDAEDWREQNKGYKIKKHSGRAYGSIKETVKKRIMKNELKRR
jgi:hypothetical protein